MTVSVSKCVIILTIYLREKNQSRYPKIISYNTIPFIIPSKLYNSNLKMYYFNTYSRYISVLRNSVHWCRWSNSIQSWIIRVNRKAGS